MLLYIVCRSSRSSAVKTVERGKKDFRYAVCSVGSGVEKTKFPAHKAYDYPQGVKRRGKKACAGLIKSGTDV